VVKKSKGLEDLLDEWYTSSLIMEVEWK
jgi:hypothetical protein